MAVDFIKGKIGSDGLALAVRQQNQLSYFTKGKIQEEINQTYLEQWAKRNYIGNDYFLNWIKAVFKTENFLAFFKYFRNPIPTASLVNNTIKQSLDRVFHAEDAYFNYVIKGNNEEVPDELGTQAFQEKIFNALLFEHNSILVHDLKGINEPFRELIPIKNVVAIESKDSEIKRLAYTANTTFEGKKVNGYVYMDADKYCFYNKDFTELLNIPHDLGECPADYISKEAFSDNDIVRKSIFSYTIEAFEEYVFLKTLLRMTEPNGVIPITVEVDAKVSNKRGKDTDGTKPMSSHEISGQKSEYQSEVLGAKNDSPLQTGTRVKVKANKKNDGSIDMDYIKNFLNFHHLPVAPLEYINGRIQEIKEEIFTSVLGDFSEENEAQKNEMQVAKSYINKQDKLRMLSLELSRVRSLSDKKMLSLKYGPKTVEVDVFYGSDFFLESQDDLYTLYGKSPNAIERKNILVRLSQNRNKFNRNKAKREKLLYELIPYSNDIDFDKALDRGIVDDISFSFQTRFDHYIGIFESIYGDIVYFWELMEGTDSERLKIMKDLLKTIIKEDYEQAKSNRAS